MISSFPMKEHVLVKVRIKEFAARLLRNVNMRKHDIFNLTGNLAQKPNIIFHREGNRKIPEC